MHIHPFVAVVLVGGAVALVSLLWDEKKPLGQPRARPRPPLTPFEQRMHVRLVEAFPESIVLAQVALMSLVTLPRRDRARVGHKAVDFVLLDRAFEVRAAIELDDESEASRHTLGEPVRALLEVAGYRTFEFNRVPEIAELRRAIPVS